MNRNDRLSLGALAAMLAMLLLVSVQGRGLMSALLLLLMAPSLFVFRWPHRVPRAHVAVFVLAMVLTATLYTLNLFARISWLDKVVHLYCGFAVTLVFGLMLYDRVLAALARARLLLATSIFCVGATIAVLWEIGEWILDRYVAGRIVHGQFDTMTDLSAGLLGALLAAGLATHSVRQRTDQTGTRDYSE